MTRRFDRERRMVALLLAFTLVIVLVNFTVFQPDKLSTNQLVLISGLGSTVMLLLGIRPPGLPRNGINEDDDDDGPGDERRTKATKERRSPARPKGDGWLDSLRIDPGVRLLCTDRLLGQAELRC